MTRIVCRRVYNVNGLALSKDPHASLDGRRPNLHLDVDTKHTEVCVVEHVYDDPEGNGLVHSGLYNLLLDDDHMVRAEEIQVKSIPDDD